MIIALIIITIVLVLAIAILWMRVHDLEKYINDSMSGRIAKLEMDKIHVPMPKDEEIVPDLIKKIEKEMEEVS